MFSSESQLELAVSSVFPLVNDTTELLVYYLSDKFPIIPGDAQLPCDADGNSLVDPLRGNYFFVSLNKDVTGAEQLLSDCLNQHPNHETVEPYTFPNEFLTKRIGGVKTTTIEHNETDQWSTEDTLYAHVCGIGMLYPYLI